MIQKQKKQSANPHLCLLFSLCLPFGGFFFYAIFIDQQFFYYITIAAMISILNLFSLRGQLNRQRGDVELSLASLQEQINLIEAQIEGEEIAIDSFSQKIVNFSQLKGMMERLGMCLTLEDTTRTLSEEVNKFFGSNDSTIILYLFHSRTGELGLSSSQKGQMRVNILSKKGDVFDQWVVKAMQPLLIEDIKSDYRFDIDKNKAEDARLIRSIISVPLLVGNKALGILRMDSPHENYFNMEDLRFLQTISDVGALTIENAQLYEHVQQLAIRDGLTDLYLRRYMQDRLKEEISRQIRRKGDLSFLLIDIDQFKNYNDKYGHTAGDIVLKTIGNHLKEFFNQPGNLVCRYGGEEFCVVLPDVSYKNAMEMAEDFRGNVEVSSILLRREKTQVTVSIGVASFPKDADTKEELIHKADQALYKAKNGGRNRVCGA